jgi:hypothetical protein
MKIETLLPLTEATQFHQLVKEANQAGAGGVRFYSEAQQLVVIGIVGQGELLTWFASPAHSHVEAMVTERVVVAGMQTASTVLAALVETRQTDVQALANDAIKKASKLH